ncbi:uncharacterized protein LOC8072978 isoform X2 [Sorghum bicolor]|uniref:uncharacterized protein LOC8072978 isoform X2 n=1 Tax=Sorghum bicolor TaxID=4558 RepID=UPI000B426504|nr:uncharacterized protein LOC8072978 isoform X2 [Sorghum bicolor]|eukprot:XP_021320368.1 uncharacterized protein LOC8072978 isoform X2 [Sorghum bicolor]
MEDVETRFNRLPRNVGFSDQSAYIVDVFGHGVNLISAYDYSYSEEIDQLVWYVLNNCDQAEKLIKKFQDDLTTSGVAAADLERRTENGFVHWFRNHMWRLNATDVVDDDLLALACGPDIRVRSYSTCVVNGVRFNTAERDKNKTTQNSRLTCTGAYRNGIIDYYGTPKEIIEFLYTDKDDGTKRSVVVFRCDWYKLDGKHTSLKDDEFYKSINISNLWCKKDSFILATQATQVFYLPDNKHGKNWRIVQRFNHRHLYNVSQIDGVASTAAPYQEQTCVVDLGRRPEVSDMPLSRDDEAGFVVHAAEIALLNKKNQLNANNEADIQLPSNFLNSIMYICEG